MRKKILLLTILFIISFIFHIKIININLNPYDEAVILVGAERILQGEVPYKDFFSQYTPGQYYALAGLFKIFGTSVITERIYDIIIKSLLSLFVFLIINLLSSYKYALIGWVMSLIWGGHINFPAYPAYPSLLFIYISIYTLLLYFKEEKRHYLILSAMSIVFAILFRHDMGGISVMVIISVLILRRITKTETSWKPLIHFLVSCIIISLPFITYLFIYSDIEAVISNLITFALNNYLILQSIPYPKFITIHTLPFFIFPGMLFTGLGIAIFSMKWEIEDSIKYGLLLLSLIGITFLIQASGRSDIVHLLPVGLTSLIVGPITIYISTKQLRLTTHQERLTIIFLVALTVITLYQPIRIRIKSFPENYIIRKINTDIPRAMFIPLRDEDIKRVINFIKEHTVEGEYIYSGLKDHDALLFNNALVYFLAERRCATRYHEMNPGFTTLPEIQKEIVNELNGKDVRLIILISGLWNAPDVNKYKHDFDILDKYIRDNFELKESFGMYEIWMRKVYE